MLIDLLSTSNYVSYNVKIAEVLGLHTAVYLSEIMNINDKAIHKNKLSGNYFSVDRSYLQSRTTLTVEEQLTIEDSLLKIGVLEKQSGENNISLNIQVITSILASSDESLIKDIAKIVKSKSVPKRTKAEVICDELKQNIVTTNLELREAYADWIDSVYAKEGWMSKKAVVSAQGVVDQFSNYDLDIALQVINIAAVNGYRDMTWAINSYKKDFNVNYKIKPVTQKLNNVKVSDESF